MSSCLRTIFAILFCILSGRVIHAEQGILVIQVSDLDRKPVIGMEITTKGDGGSAITDRLGKARITLPRDTRPGNPAVLMIGKSPMGKEYVLISPFDGGIFIPPFENESQNFISVFVAERGDPHILRTAPAILTVSARLDKAISAKTSDAHPTAQVHAAALDEVSRTFGLTAREIEDAIHSWGSDALDWKLVTLTGAFEGGTEMFSNVVGDFDGQVLEFGVGFWSVRQCTLQPLLSKMRQADPQQFDFIMGPDTDFTRRFLEALCPESIEIAQQSMLDETKRVKEPWKTRFTALGLEPKFQRIEIEQLKPLVERAGQQAAQFNFRSERAVALFYDIDFQNGGVKSRARDAYLADIVSFIKEVRRQPDEEERLLMLAVRVAQSTNRRFTSYVLARKATIALGKGTVTGREYDLQTLRIELRDVKTGEFIKVHHDAAILKRIQAGWDSQSKPDKPPN